MNKKQQELEQKLYQRNFMRWGFDMNLTVTGISALLILTFCAFAFFSLDATILRLNQLYDFIIGRFDWLFLLATSFFIGICLFLAFSKTGDVRIGGVGAEPEFSTFSWYAMLISAGMGSGLLFWGVGEPLTHAHISPFIYGAGGSNAQALAATFFHWGFHPWSIYALLGLSLAFFAYNQHLPLSLRSIFYPIFKEKIFGRLGDVIDILAILACLFGLATSLGLGVQQMNSGLAYLTGLAESTSVQMILIAIITTVAIVSIVAGIDKGVRFLSVVNIRLSGLLLLIIFALGPTLPTLRLFIDSVGLYANDFISASFSMDPAGNAWRGKWTVFYLAWWVSWSPFVGMFIARMSRGRKVREFLLAVMFIPSLLSFLWMSVFGSTAISVNQKIQGALYQTVENNLPIALFEMIGQLNIPFLASILSPLILILATLLVISFFVTSSDSGSLVVERIAASGKSDTPTKQRVLWALLEGALAAVLLLIGGSQALNALRTAVISSGLPFLLVLIVAAFSAVKGLRQAARQREKYIENQLFKNVRESALEDIVNEINAIDDIEDIKA